MPAPRRDVRSTSDGGSAVQPPGLSYTAHWEALGCALCLLTTPEISSTDPMRGRGFCPGSHRPRACVPLVVCGPETFCFADSLPQSPGPGPCSPAVFCSAICDCLSINGCFSLTHFLRWFGFVVWYPVWYEVIEYISFLICWLVSPPDLVPCCCASRAAFHIFLAEPFPTEQEDVQKRRALEFEGNLTQSQI